MKYRITTLLATSAAAALLFAGVASADTAPAPAPMPYPAMTAPLAANPNPASFDAGPLGKINVGGVISGGGFYQSNPMPGQEDSYGDIDNAMLIINKSDGPIQFYLQAGAYSTPALGYGYTRSTTLDPALFGYVPQGFIKFVPNSSFSVEVGALPTLIGDEYTFTFENMNIERGLLWGQEPAVSKGVQVNFSHGPLAMSAAWTDGYYSDTYTALSGLIAYTLPNSDVITFAAEGNVATNHHVGYATPFQQNQGSIYNIIYSHTSGPWTITPYIQYNTSPHNQWGSQSGDTWGGAILTKYNFTPEFSLSARGEYIKSDGPANLLGYGVDSSAWSLTLTPAYQKGIFFIRGEASYTGVDGADHSFIIPAVPPAPPVPGLPAIFVPGLAFGHTGDEGSQFRLMAEAGIIF